MREYKIFSFFVFLFYLIVLILNFYTSYSKTNIENNHFLKKQLMQLNDKEARSSIIVYGSSGVLFGLSSVILSRHFDRAGLNISTAGSGEDLHQVIDILFKQKINNRIIIHGDRNYRNNNWREPILPFITKVWGHLAFLPTLRGVLANDDWINLSRDGWGDFHGYGKSVFEIDKRPKKLHYSDLHIQLMRAHIQSSLEGGMCPILVFVPLLVTKESTENELAATANLVTRLKEADLYQYVASIPMIETDKELFTDASHMSALGKEKWTRLLAEEILARNMCGLGDAKLESRK